MPININGNTLSSSTTNSGGQVINYKTIVSSNIVIWLDAGRSFSLYDADYYDCGYGCQYYSSDPGCTPCYNQWNDLSPRGYRGTLTNGAAYSTLYGGSIQFDGSNDYVGIGDMGDFSTFTVEIWFKSNSVSNYRNPIDCNWLVYNGSYSNIGPRLEQNSSGNLTWVVGDNSGNYSGVTVVSSGLSSTPMHCAVITKSGTSSFESYYNGNYVTSTTFANWRGSMSNVNIGKGFSSSAERWFNGNVAIVRIYSTALSSTQVLQNFNADRGRFGI